MINSFSMLQLLQELSKKSFLYYKSLLSCFEQQTYNQIINGLFQYTNAIRVRNHSFRTIKKIIEMICLDNPTLFYIKDYSIRQYAGNIEVIPNYRFSKDKAESTLIALYNTLDEAVCKYRYCNEAKKVIFVHDLLCKNVKYTDDNLDSDHECVGPLLFRSGVCEGISKAAKLLFDLLNVDSVLIKGQADSVSPTHNSSGHMWNCVKIDSNYYHFDITFDLSLIEYQITRYDYFGLSDSHIAKDHTFSKNKPICKHTLNYYKTNSLFFSRIQSLQEYVNRMLRAGKKDMVFQVDSEQFYTTLRGINEMVKGIITYYPEISAYEIYHNDKSGVCHLHLK